MGKPFKQNSPANPSSSKKKGPEIDKVQNESDSDSEDTLASLELHKFPSTSEDTQIILVCIGFGNLVFGIPCELN